MLLFLRAANTLPPYLIVPDVCQRFLLITRLVCLSFRCHVHQVLQNVRGGVRPGRDEWQDAGLRRQTYQSDDRLEVSLTFVTFCAYLAARSALRCLIVDRLFFLQSGSRLGARDERGGEVGPPVLRAAEVDDRRRAAAGVLQVRRNRVRHRGEGSQHERVQGFRLRQVQEGVERGARVRGVRQEVQGGVRRAEETETRSQRRQVQQRPVHFVRRHGQQLRHIELRQEQHQSGDRHQLSQLGGLHAAAGDRAPGVEPGSAVEAVRHSARPGLLPPEDRREIQDAARPGGRRVQQSERGGVRAREVPRLRVPARPSDDRQARPDERAAEERGEARWLDGRRRHQRADGSGASGGDDCPGDIADTGGWADRTE